MIKDITAMIVSLLVLGLIPIHSAPFGGCNTSGYSTLLLGCSDWPEFSRGFLLITSLALLSQHKSFLSLFGLCIALVISMCGGIVLIKTGLAPSYFLRHFQEISQHFNHPLFIGALSAYSIYLFLLVTSSNFTFWKK